MGAAAAEADRTLFVGNLEPNVTEELLFELFHQAGPVVKVKIPKDRDGKAKQFAFVNFKHEESVPYGMSLLNGIKLFGRPLKIQFRSGSRHVSQDNGALYAAPNGGLSGAQQLPATSASNRYERSTDHLPAASLAAQRSFSCAENPPRQAQMNSAVWQPPLPLYSGRHASPHSEPSGFASPGHQPSLLFPPAAQASPWCPEAAAPPQPRKGRPGPQPYPAAAEGVRHYGREQHSPHWGGGGSSDHSAAEFHFRGHGREERCPHDRSHGGWSHNYDHRREAHRDGKWRPSRH